MKLTLKNKQLQWLLILPLFYSIYFSLWGFGILERDFFLNQNPFYFFLSQLHYFIALYIVYAFYVVLYQQEDKMNNLFNRTITAICIGIVVWFLLAANAAF